MLDTTPTDVLLDCHMSIISLITLFKDTDSLIDCRIKLEEEFAKRGIEITTDDDGE